MRLTPERPALDVKAAVDQEAVGDRSAAINFDACGSPKGVASNTVVLASISVERAELRELTRSAFFGSSPSSAERRGRSIPGWSAS